MTPQVELSTLKLRYGNTVSSVQLKEYAANIGRSYQFVYNKLKNYKTGRGVWTLTEEVEQLEQLYTQSTTVTEREDLSFVPSKDPSFVPFGNFPDLKKVREIYSPKGVRFLLLNANLQDNAETISKEATEFNIDFAILVDESQVAGKLLQLRRTAEAIVINPTTWKVVYRGPVNDRIAYESQKPDATNNYLADALDAQLKGELPEKRQRKSKGCLIKFKN